MYIYFRPSPFPGSRFGPWIFPGYTLSSFQDPSHDASCGWAIPPVWKTTGVTWLPIIFCGWPESPAGIGRLDVSSPGESPPYRSLHSGVHPYVGRTWISPAAYHCEVLDASHAVCLCLRWVPFASSETVASRSWGISPPLLRPSRPDGPSPATTPPASRPGPSSRPLPRPFSLGLDPSPEELTIRRPEVCPSGDRDSPTGNPFCQNDRSSWSPVMFVIG